jgi:hypothetical protein
LVRSAPWDRRGGAGKRVLRGGHTVTLATGLKAPADLVVDRRRGWLIVPENDANRLIVYHSDIAAR